MVLFFSKRPKFLINMILCVIDVVVRVAPGEGTRPIRRNAGSEHFRHLQSNGFRDIALVEPMQRACVLTRNGPVKPKCLSIFVFRR